VRDDGFSILEALIAIAIVTTAAVSLAQALTVSSRVNAGARVASIAAILAIDKMEQLKAVGWDDPSLQPSPADALVVDTPGYVEYLDAGGAPLLPQPSGPPPAGTVYVRRWLVDPAQAAPNTLALQVIVVRWPRQGSLDVSRLTAARTRAR
jgi:type II secretory pathway pseudopilin PulG